MCESSTLEKQNAFQSMLLTGRVLIWINMLNEALVVPHALRIMPQSPLAYTPEVRPSATEEGIAALMWLGGRVFETFVPWKAIYLMASRRGHMSWLEHAPANLSADDIEDLYADLDAEYDDEVVVCELDAEAIVGAIPATGVPTSELVAAAQPPPQRSDAGDVSEPEHADTASSTGTAVPRASRPSLTVILGGVGQDSED